MIDQQKPWDRTFQFWTRAITIYSSYKKCQLHTRFLSKEKEEKVWEAQHEWGAEKVYSLCYDLGGFFLKVAQLIGKPDLAPDAWVRKLVTLCDAAPATPFPTVKYVLEREFNLKIEDLFENFHEDPIGSASVAQVHRARLKGSNHDVAVKVQHPGAEKLMMTDIRNLRTFAALVRRFDLKFDMLSVVDELEEQVGLEFDFEREARSMGRIANSFASQKQPPVLIPRPIPNLVTRRVLIMQFMEGTPILKLGEEMAKRGINPSGAMARLTKRNILHDLTAAYGHMILKDGFFHADPHPGNILINKNGKIALLDFGQVKEFSNSLRLDYAKLVLALNTRNPFKIAQCFEKLGILLGSSVEADSDIFLRIAYGMFDTKISNVEKYSPFGKQSVLDRSPVEKFPKDLFFVLRTVQILRGLSVGMGVPYSCVEEWEGIAREALAEEWQESIVSADFRRKQYPRELVWEKRKKFRRIRFNLFEAA